MKLPTCWSRVVRLNDTDDTTEKYSAVEHVQNNNSKHNKHKNSTNQTGDSKIQMNKNGSWQQTAPDKRHVFLFFPAVAMPACNAGG